MGFGGYSGGSTIIGPRSGWFSKPLTKAEKERHRLEDEARLLAAVQRKKAKNLAAQAEVQRKAQLVAEVRASPAYQAKKLAEREAQKKNRAARKARKEASRSVEIYVKVGGKHVLRPPVIDGDQAISNDT